MKNITNSLLTVLVLILAAFSINSFAQAQVNAGSSAHLTFKGVPIDGTLNEYVSKLKKSGFTLIGIENGIAMLQGDFAAYKNCAIVVATLKQKDLVSKITVIFPECDTWSSLSSDYFTLKELLTEKYGEPSESIEKFQSDIQPRDDNDKMHEVRMNECKYYTTYETDKGDIQLSIEHDGSMMRSFVMLSYYDKKNSDIIRAEALKDL